MSALAWFIAGGLSALVIARLLARWLHRVFWMLVAATFAIWALLVAGPSLGLGGLSDHEIGRSLASTRGVLEVARDWLGR